VLIAPPGQDALPVAEPVEHEQGTVAGAAEVAVVGGALLPAVGRADRAVRVEDDPGALAGPVRALDPPAGQVHQPVQVRAGRGRLGLEPADLAGRGGGMVPSPTAGHGVQRGIDA
jgi:hypothetical protein